MVEMIIAFIGNSGTGKTTIAKEQKKSWSVKMGENAAKARQENIFELIERSRRRNKTKLLGLGCSNGKFTLSASKEI